MTDSAYQVMPPLSHEERSALRAEIADRGVLVPIVKDQHGNILDGHHRKDIADELGVPYRIDVVQVGSDDEARSLARMYNLARRHLTREQKRALIAGEIQAGPDRSDREIARLMGCDHKTVGSVRRELSGEIPHPKITKAEAETLTGNIKASIERMQATIAEGPGLPFHPIAEQLLPLTVADFALSFRLAESVQRHGLIHPITTYEGLILDGRLRYMACLAAGVLPEFTPLEDDTDPMAYWVSMNMIRSHFDEDQMAVIVARLDT